MPRNAQWRTCPIIQAAKHVANQFLAHGCIVLLFNRCGSYEIASYGVGKRECAAMGILTEFIGDGIADGSIRVPPPFGSKETRNG